MLLLLYHLGCNKYEVKMMSGTLKQKKGYPVYIVLSKQDTDIYTWNSTWFSWPDSM